MTTILSLGQQYIPGRSQYPEAVQYNWRGGQHELLMWLASPSRAEISDIRQGQAEFALVVEPPLIVLLYRFGRAIPWSDAPYSWHLVPEAEQTLPDTTDAIEPHALLQVILVDASTGLVQGLRAVSFSPAFTAALHSAIAEQAGQPWDAGAYNAALASLYGRYPSSTELLGQARSRTRGGR